MKNSIKIPEYADVKVKEGSLVVVNGPEGEYEKEFYHPLINIEVKKDKIIVETKSKKKKVTSQINTITSKIKSLVVGVKDPFEYKLKVCSSHFPMNVSVKGNKLVIKNYTGEKKSREIKLFDGIDVNINNDIIVLKSPDKELAGNQAGMIESKVRVYEKDRRKFQDGIYIIEKAGRKIV